MSSQRSAVSSAECGVTLCRIWYYIYMNINRDIQTLSEFKQNASKLIKQVQKTKNPVVLTVNGKPAAVIQDVDTYQRMSDSKEYKGAVTILRQRLADIGKFGQWPTHKEVFDQIRKKFNIERD